MSTSFRQPFEIIQRNIGTIVNGKYRLDDNVGVKITIQATVQQPSPGDMNMIEATAYGRRASRYIKIYTDERLHCANQAIAPDRNRYPGDLFIFDGSHYLLFGESDFTMLAKSRQTQASHYRYFACEILEDADMEQAP